MDQIFKEGLEVETRIKFRSMAMFFVFFLISHGAIFAAEKNQSSLKRGGATPNVLDFDADIIEGERSGPSLLVQLDLQAPGLDTLIFQRKNFNDFHVIDMKRKPKYRGRPSK